MQQAQQDLHLSRWLSIFVLSLLIVLGLNLNHGLLAQSSQGAGWGELINPAPEKYSEFAVNVRRTPPSVTPFGLKLGEKICAVKNGTQFSYAQVHTTLNNQVWYEVEIQNPISYDVVCPKPVRGWLIGQKGDYTDLVKTFNVQPSSPTTTSTETPTSSLPSSVAASPVEDPSPEVTSPTTAPEKNGPSSEKISKNAQEKTLSWQIFSRYMLVCLGAVLGLFFVTFEQVSSHLQDDAPQVFLALKRRMRSPVFFIRVVLLILASFVFILLIDSIGTNNEWLGSIRQLAAQGILEPITAGFLIALVVLNFIAFSKGHDS